MMVSVKYLGESPPVKSGSLRIGQQKVDVGKVSATVLRCAREGWEQTGEGVR